MADFRDPRMSERKFYRIEPLALTSNGTIDGIVKVSNTYAIKVGQKVTIRSSTQQPRVLKIKGVLSETDVLIGAFDTPISKGTDLTDFLVADSAEIVVPEQKRPAIDPVDIQGMVFDEEPTVALRSHLVDWLGRSYEANNPMPVQLSDGSIDIGTVNAQIETQLTHRDNYPDSGDENDSVRIGDGQDELAVNDDGSINVRSNTIKTPNIINTTVNLADTEYQISIPGTTKKIMLKSRKAALLRLAFSAGQSDYITLKPGSVYKEDDLSLDGPMSIYLTANKDDIIIETLYWE